jgi:hypothetical protein
MAFGSLDPARSRPHNRVYGKNDQFAIASALRSRGACLRTCSRGMRRSLGRVQYPTSAHDDGGIGGIAVDAEFRQCARGQQLIAHRNFVSFDCRRDGVIRVLGRFRIFRERSYFSDERRGRSERTVHRDFHADSRRKLAGQHFFSQQRFRRFSQTDV